MVLVIDEIADRRQAGQLVAALVTGRDRVGDPAQVLLGDTPLEVARHVANHRGDISTQVLMTEFRSAWELAEHTRREADRTQHNLIKGLRRRGVPWSRIAELLELNSRQAAEALAQRLEAACAGESKDPRRARARRDRPAVTAETVAAPGRDGRVRDVIAALLAVQDLLPDNLEELTGFDIDDLRRAARPDLVDGDGVRAQIRVMVRELGLADGLNEQVRATVIGCADLLGMKVLGD